MPGRAVCVYEEALLFGQRLSMRGGIEFSAQHGLLGTALPVGRRTEVALQAALGRAFGREIPVRFCEYRITRREATMPHGVLLDEAPSIGFTSLACSNFGRG